MIATCARPACGTCTDLPDSQWIVLRPLTWNAFVEEQTFCSPRCAADWLYETHRPQELLP